MGEIRVKSENLFPSDIAWYRNNNYDPNNHADSQTGQIKSDVFPIYYKTSDISVTMFNPPSISDFTLVSIRFYSSDLTNLGSSTSVIPEGAKYASLLYGSNSGQIDASTKTALANAQISVTNSQTAPTSYQPYFLNLPSHQKTSTGWKDIPTHTMTATGWHGELTSQSPLKFRATGQSLLDWRVEGRTSENLFDVNRAYSSTWTLNTSSYMIAAATVSQVYPNNAQVIINSNGSITVTSYENGYGALFLINAEPNKTYTLSFDVSKQSSGSCAAITSRKQNGNVIPDSHATASNTSITYTTPNDTAYIAICLRFPASDGEVTYSNVMLVKGSTAPSTYTPYTALPYEPYGGVGDWDETEQRYVIPVNVNGTTTNLYTTAQLMDGDSLDYTTDQTAIPITQGDNTLTVDTAVQPSKVYVKFEG